MIAPQRPQAVPIGEKCGLGESQLPKVIADVRFQDGSEVIAVPTHGDA
jgi:hypothetical protein